MPAPAATPARDLHGLRILVVEDDPDSLELTTTLLETVGAQVVACDAARAALAVIEQTAVDLLVADIGLPHEDGLWLIREVRRQETAGRRLPAVAVTALATPRDRQTVLDAGYDAHVPKPLDLDMLLERIERVRGKQPPS
jgi:two-component system CheB/CheR fusion protein